MKLAITAILMFTILSPIRAATRSQSHNDSASVRRAVFEYAEGIFSGDPSRLERTVHPDFIKAFPRLLNRTGRRAPSYTTYSQLMENARAKNGALPDTARHLQVLVLNIDADIANARLASSAFNEYLQLAKQEGKWRIVNALGTGALAKPALPQGQLDQEERSKIENAALTYLEGIGAADAKRLEMALDPDFSKATLAPAGKDARTAIFRQRYAGLVENAYARTGKIEENVRHFRAKVIDAVDGLAVVDAQTMLGREYLQVYRQGDQWRVLNSLARQDLDQPLDQFLPAFVGGQMPDFTLPIFGGGEYTLSKHRGKNILLIFPRGWLGRSWCPYCPYQYLELAELDRQNGLREKLGLEIVFVLPYDTARIADWFDKFSDALETVERAKNPADTSGLGRLQREYIKWAREHYPKRFQVERGKVPVTFPVLADAERTLSRRLKLFTNYWDGVSSEQNMASYFIIDGQGKLRLKYISQMTEDRPSVDYLLDYIRKGL